MSEERETVAVVVDTSGAEEDPAGVRRGPPDTVPEKMRAKRQTKYTHLVCDTECEMSDEVASEFYSDPDRYSSLYCPTCNAGIRIGADGEMVWTGTKDKVRGV